MNEEDLKCQQKDELEYVTLFSDTLTLLKLVHKTKKAVSEMTMNE